MATTCGTSRNILFSRNTPSRPDIVLARWKYMYVSHYAAKFVSLVVSKGILSSRNSRNSVRRLIVFESGSYRVPVSSIFRRIRGSRKPFSCSRRINRSARRVIACAKIEDVFSQHVIICYFLECFNTRSANVPYSLKNSNKLLWKWRKWWKFKYFISIHHKEHWKVKKFRNSVFYTKIGDPKAVYITD